MTSDKLTMLELPHTEGCLVCGRSNPHGLHLHLSVDPDTGRVSVPFVPGVEHIGFAGIIHGGILATVLDEAMVWAASWPSRRFCVAGELTVRYKRSATVGDALTVTAQIESSRPRMIKTVGEIRDAQDNLLAAATGKYVPMPPDQSELMFKTMVREPHTARAYDWLVNGKR